jgi:hypothetical protein
VQRSLKHDGEISLSYEISDESIASILRSALAMTEVYVVHASEIGSWGADVNIAKIVHDGKTLSRTARNRRYRL